MKCMLVPAFLFEPTSAHRPRRLRPPAEVPDGLSSPVRAALEREDTLERVAPERSGERAEEIAGQAGRAEAVDGGVRRPLAGTPPEVGAEVVVVGVLEDGLGDVAHAPAQGGEAV